MVVEAVVDGALGFFEMATPRAWLGGGKTRLKQSRNSHLCTQQGVINT